MSDCQTCGKPNPDPIYARYRALEAENAALKFTVGEREHSLSVHVQTWMDEAIKEKARAEKAEARVAELEREAISVFCTLAEKEDWNDNHETAEYWWERAAMIERAAGRESGGLSADADLPAQGTGSAAAKPAAPTMLDGRETTASIRRRRSAENEEYDERDCGCGT